MTKEQAKERANVMLAYANGATIQCKLGPWDSWSDIVGPLFSTNYEYRIKPTPTLRPWKDATEVPPAGFLIQFEEKSLINGSYLVIARDNDGLVYSNTATHNPTLTKSFYKNLLGAKHSLDHSKTWLPCGVYDN